MQIILNGMQWVGLHADNADNIVYQTQNFPRYKELIQQLLNSGHAYHCYCSKEELEQMREKAEREGTATYDRRWRPEAGKTLPEIPAGVEPVVRFKMPTDGVTRWNDLVKGEISIPNAALDDLIIARADGTPTYNFCVVVDDLDMGITHVIRGDDHVNNTPRQINILRALGAEPPVYGHLPMINGPDGQKLSKRHGAVSVLQYQEEGFLPDAIINYLARLGWSHGDDELFSREQLIEWFDGSHLSVSPAQLDFDKFRWVNQQYLKALPDAELAAEVGRRLQARGVPVVLGGQPVPDDRLAAMCALWKDRSPTWVVLTDWVAHFFAPPAPDAAVLAQKLTDAVRPAVAEFMAGLPAVAGDREAIGALMKTVLKNHGLKMPQLAVPLRLMVFGVEQTPSVDAMLAQLPADEIAVRVGRYVS